MHARLARLRLDPRLVDVATVLTRDEIIPTFTAQRGALHGYWMVERATGHAMTVMCWADDDSLTAAGAAIGRVRDDVITTLGAHLVETGSYLLDGVSGREAPMQGRREWSCVTFVEGLPRDGREVPGELARTAHRLHDDDPGFHSVCWLVQPASGLGISITSWEDEAALRAAEPTGWRSRRRFESAFGCRVEGREIVETLAAVGIGAAGVVDLDAPVRPPVPVGVPVRP